jgi:hypothetical protein
MKHVEKYLRQAREMLDNLGIHPLVLALGALFCLFFPRFFLLAAFGYAVYWIAKNIWLDPRHKDGRKGPRKH